MNVYDFDKTIYDGDSTVNFYLSSLRKHPLLCILAPVHLSGFIGYFLGYRSKTKAKERFYSFLKFIPDIDSEISLFWDKNMKKIKKWYYNNKRNDDLVISASPEFLVGEACRRLGIDYMASVVNKKNGTYEGKNCHGKEKVRRFFSRYPDSKIEEFYSDSYSDTPLAELAGRAFIVKKNEIKNWKE